MSYDFYAELSSQHQCPATANVPAGLAAGFVDGCAAWFAQGELQTDQRTGNRMKNDARMCYINRAQGRDSFPSEISDLLDRPIPVVQPDWLAVEVRFILQSPWYSKDDRPFHILDNPVRKDRVFGIPYMAAASWKGLLRWSCRMDAGLVKHLQENDEKLHGWKDPDWIVHFFGNDKDGSDGFGKGALAFFPTWFPRVDFDVINPHSRETRAGTQPIYYEVVPARYKQNGARVETKAALRLLYAPVPGNPANGRIGNRDALIRLFHAIEKLLTLYGFSAKRTAGWGLAAVEEWEIRGRSRVKTGNLTEISGALDDHLNATEAAS